jgi:hypothetical protein
MVLFRWLFTLAAVAGTILFYRRGSTAMVVVTIAERQMNESIRLFFERRDSVVVHTLAAASDQVVRLDGASG